ncbi:MAG: Poly(3-hydroxyalkanoate) polymerase subunit PhaC [Myxococcota bacterium]|nr:Poly(3-hydroxyalkanoate) polymerase subunit PhaC [Myxococcota bacterium]
MATTSPTKRTSALRKPRKVLSSLADKALQGFVNGVALLTDGSLTPVGATPSVLAYRKDKLAVHFYPRQERDSADIGTENLEFGAQPIRTPVLIIPPLMVQPYIYDLRPGHSMVEYFTQHGANVYLVDFGIPDERDIHVTLDTYVADWIDAAVQAALGHSGQKQIHLFGYCMGGIFSLMYTAWSGGGAIKTILSTGTPIDFEKLGMLSFAARAAGGQVDRVTRLLGGNIPGEIPSAAMRFTTPIKSMTRMADLFVNLYDEEYIKGYNAMQRWAKDFVPYPADAFKQLVNEFMLGNKLVTGELRLANRPVDLRTVTCPIIAFAGRSDTVAAFAAVKEIIRKTGSREVEFHEVPGGHIGVLAGSKAPEKVWAPSIDWMRRHDA